MLFKNLINEPISVNIGSFRSDFQKHSKNLRSSRFEGKAERRRLIPSLSIPAKSDKTEIELKSLILAQIERWRHALHMQVERQHKELAPGWRVAHG